MKRPASCLSSYESNESQFIINKPLPRVIDNSCIIIQDTNFDTASIETNISECMSLDSGMYYVLYVKLFLLVLLSSF